MPRASVPSLPQERIYPVNIQYVTVRRFLSLREKVGAILGIGRFKDDRSDKQNVGHQTGFQGVSNYFKSEPFPLEDAVSGSLSKAVSHLGVKTVPIRNWDGRAESLKNIEADSILTIEITKFWTEGVPAGHETKMITSIYLVIHLGVKKLGRVFTKKVYLMKEKAVPILTRDEVEQTLNRNLNRTLDDFLSNPY